MCSPSAGSFEQKLTHPDPYQLPNLNMHREKMLKNPVESCGALRSYHGLSDAITHYSTQHHGVSRAPNEHRLRIFTGNNKNSPKPCGRTLRYVVDCVAIANSCEDVGWLRDALGITGASGSVPADGATIAVECCHCHLIVLRFGICWPMLATCSASKVYELIRKDKQEPTGGRLLWVRCAMIIPRILCQPL